jgi:hypothetical protein
MAEPGSDSRCSGVTRDASAKGSAVVLVVRGSGFIASSTVRLAGEAMPTT